MPFELFQDTTLRRVWWDNPDVDATISLFDKRTHLLTEVTRDDAREMDEAKRWICLRETTSCALHWMAVRACTRLNFCPFTSSQRGGSHGLGLACEVFATADMLEG